MFKRLTTLVKFQNRKPYPKKTQVVVYCVKKWAVEKTEKLQNKGTTYLLKGMDLSANGSQRVDSLTQCLDLEMTQLRLALRKTTTVHKKNKV